MGLRDLLKRDDDNDDEDPVAARERRERAEQDIARVKRGSIPLAVEERLQRLGAGTGAFTSGLSVASYALTQAESIRPVCQVMGATVYKAAIGVRTWAPTTNFHPAAVLLEVDAVTRAWNEARTRALRRLAEEARIADCDAVLDVTFERKAHASLAAEIEVVVTGTAVRLPKGEATGAEPLLTDLSMADYTLLRRGGYTPVGIVTSTSVFYVRPSLQNQRLAAAWRGSKPNAELEEFGLGISEARARALDRAAAQARKVRAAGMVGMRIEREMEMRDNDNNKAGSRDLLVVFHVVGTAIARRGGQRDVEPSTILRLGAKT